MDTQRAKKLFQKLGNGTLTPEERLLLNAWYYEYFKSALPLNDTAIYERNIKAMDAAFSFERLGVKTVRLWPNLAGTAAILFVLGIGAWLYKSMQSDKNTETVYANDRVPGTNAATLTLASGRKIVLENQVIGRTVRQPGLNITKTANGQVVYQVTDAHQGELKYDALTTGKGQQFEIILPDLTKVWLNAASSIKFPETFIGLKERKVELTGEAYFEVAKVYRSAPKDKLGTRDKQESVPFIVTTTKQNIEVLGTHFNINSYADEPQAKTSLLEGSVKVTSPANIQVILKPCQQATSFNGEISVKHINADDAIDWKNNAFIFKDDDLRSTMRKIARWYDVEVVYDVSAPIDFVPGGYVSRSKNISSVLDIMASTGMIHFKIVGRRVIVTK